MGRKLRAKAASAAKRVRSSPRAQPAAASQPAGKKPTQPKPKRRRRRKPARVTKRGRRIRRRWVADPGAVGFEKLTFDACEAAFEATARERAALPEAEVGRVNVDVQAVTLKLHAHGATFRRLAREIAGAPHIDAHEIEKIETYILALVQAQLEWKIAAKPKDRVPELAAEAAATRRRLSTDARALAERKLINGAKLDALSTGNGYQELSYDLGSLSAFLRSVWSKIDGKTAITREELVRAQWVAEQLTMALAARMGRSRSALRDAADQRARAYTLLLAAYDQARRAATFLYWGEDIDAIVPAFHNGRSGGWATRRKKAAAREAAAREAAEREAAAHEAREVAEREADEVSASEGTRPATPTVPRRPQG